MSDFFAVAGVTSVLKWMLSDGLVSSGVNASLPSAATISTLSPDLVPTGTGEASLQVNLFMYYASFNPAYRNTDLPSRDSGGTRVSNPPLGLNLHYLISAYGKSELDPEILLAWVMQTFHESPILSRIDDPEPARVNGLRRRHARNAGRRENHAGQPGGAHQNFAPSRFRTRRSPSSGWPSTPITVRPPRIRSR